MECFKVPDEYLGVVAETLYATLDAAEKKRLPHILYRPTITQDGTCFIALLGENLQEGIAGCGDTPEEAMADFDTTWKTPAKSKGGALKNLLAVAHEIRAANKEIIGCTMGLPTFSQVSLNHLDAALNNFTPAPKETP